MRTAAKNVIHLALNSGEVDVAICIEGGDDRSEDALSSRFVIELSFQQLRARSRLAVMTEDCAAPAAFVSTSVKFDGTQYLVRPFRLDTEPSAVPENLYFSMVARATTRTVDCCLEHERQTSD